MRYRRMANDQWHPNPGRLPVDVRPTDFVHVRLRNGWTSLNGAPWPAERGTNWRIGNPPHPFDICDYRLAT